MTLDPKGGLVLAAAATCHWGSDWLGEHHIAGVVCFGSLLRQLLVVIGHDHHYRHKHRSEWLAKYAKSAD